MLPWLRDIQDLADQLISQATVLSAVDLSMGLICNIRASLELAIGVRHLVVVSSSAEVLVEVSGAVSKALREFSLKIGSILLWGFVLLQRFLSSNMVH